MVQLLKGFVILAQKKVRDFIRNTGDQFGLCFETPLKPHPEEAAERPSRGRGLRGSSA